MSALKFATSLIFALIILHVTKASNIQSEKNGPRKGQGRPPSHGRRDVIELKPEFLSVNKGKGYFNLTVTRTHASNREVSVRVKVVNGNAKRRKDYVSPRCQVLKFRPRETHRVVTYKIIDDNVWEPVEIFTVCLCGPRGGAFIGRRKCSRVTIYVNDDIDICRLRPKPVRCTGEHLRYYYDRRTNTCKIFSHGGCGGNKNRFKTENQCLKKCCTSIPTQPDIIGFDLTAVPTIERTNNYVYLPVKRERFGSSRTVSVNWNVQNGTALHRKDFGGPEKGTLVFKTDETEKNISIPIIVDQRPESTEQFYVHLSIRSGDAVLDLDKKVACVTIYEDDCDDLDKCFLEPETGPCKAKIPRFYYDHKTKTCEEFIYGGCEGNGNRFKTVDECLDECFDSPTITTSGSDSIGFIGFITPSIRVFESKKHVILTLERTLPFHEAHVQIALENGSAEAYHDYIVPLIPIVVRFEKWVTIKNVEILIIDDDEKEPPEEFFAELWGNVGAGIGPIRKCEIRIVDDD